MNRILRFLILFYAVLFVSFSRCPASSRQTPVVKVIKENASSVVNISTEKVIYLRERPIWGYYDSEYDSFFNRYLGRTYAMRYKSIGSGVIIDKSGLVVTNAHVVNMASTIIVILDDGRELKGKMVYLNTEDDVAIVKIETFEGIKPVKLALSGDEMIGESVIAVGNPLGLENSVTVGVLSGRNREFVTSDGNAILTGLLQTDAPINPGNSGGALLNLDGELLGINVAVVQNSQSIGFAIPVEKIRKSLESYKLNKKVPLSKKHSFSKKTPVDQGASEEDSGVDPFSKFERLREEMNRLFYNSFDSSPGKTGNPVFDSSFSYDSGFDIEENNDKYIVKLQIENIDEQNIKVEINNRLLTVTGESEQKDEDISAASSYSSMSKNYFSKSIMLPPDADTEDIKTEKTKDLLIIELQKKI